MIAIFPELAQLAATKEFEKLAVEVRRYFGEQHAAKPSIDVDVLISNIGLSAARLNMDSMGMIAASDEQGAFSVKMAWGVNHVPGHELRFLKAHLLGHFFLHFQTEMARSEWKTKGLKETVSPAKRYAAQSTYSSDAVVQNECEADEFAACLLLPKGMVLRAFEAIPDIVRIADLFKVSKEVVHARLCGLGVITKVFSPSFAEAEEKLHVEKDIKQSQLLNSGDQLPLQHQNTSDRNLRSKFDKTSVSQLSDKNSGLDGQQLQVAIADRLPFGVRNKTPRSFAASTYNRNERQASASTPEEVVAKGGVEGPSQNFQKPSKKIAPVRQSQADQSAQVDEHLRRIRSLAKRLDPSVED